VSPSRPHLVPPALASRLPGIRRATTTAVVVGVLTAVTIVAQAVALATAVNRSLLQHAPLSSVEPQLVVVIAAIAVRALLALFGELSAHRSAETVVTDLQGQLLRHALALGPGWLSGERPGELSLTATRGLRSLHTYVARYIPQAALAAAIPFLLLCWVATQDWLSLIVVVVLVIAVPITMIYFGREANRRSERQWRRLGSLAGRFLQLIEGLPTLRAFGRDEYGRREVAASTEGVRVATMRTLRVAFLSALTMDLIAGFGVGLVAMVLGLRLLWGDLTFQTAMAVLLVAPEIFVPLRRAGAEFHASTEGQAAAVRVMEVLDAPTNSDESVASTPSALLAPVGPPDLRIERLRIAYADRAVAALNDFSLHVPPGGRVALIGPSGSGKSSVLSALLRFTMPETGSIHLGDHSSVGTDVRRWRSYFSWVPQRPYLFTASLSDNLRLGAVHATVESLHQVIEAVGLGDLVAHLPHGLDTLLGQDGLTLSSGERQRVALARALLCPAPILLLDEPTASLDAATIGRISDALEPWLSGRTIVVASHEPLLLARFDTVVSLSLPIASAALS
jgi:ATP-binding cassette, subfamily C, bacterial CydCD